MRNRRRTAGSFLAFGDGAAAATLPAARTGFAAFFVRAEDRVDAAFDFLSMSSGLRGSGLATYTENGAGAPSSGDNGESTAIFRMCRGLSSLLSSSVVPSSGRDSRWRSSRSRGAFGAKTGTSFHRSFPCHRRSMSAGACTLPTATTLRCPRPTMWCAMRCGPRAPSRIDSFRLRRTVTGANVA